MDIRLLRPSETPPYELLLLADPSRHIVDDYLKRGECFLIEENDLTIGVYVLLPTRPETAELVNIAVIESRQGKGLGKKLISHAIEQARASAFKILEVGTGNSSLPQLALYQKCGFRMTGVDSGFFIRHYEEEIWENGIQCRDMVRLQMDLS
ncbi:GNAT family N-acetyltransferase [Domibacillus sp. A3M-37]|uniref:GNAT family N-acetyltransferase n=1 Tax=Domibacillus sp. A3M-37 TaxID=2962037 RepID=UPI0020B6DB7C|nr:GNAT family N-acetyltransferase [Domibacillus sp. A3M-37]MCP3760931.1 GNAT family N-acetyltransferase [Domibacillus sp. A3M-37]